jgi:hypothetical protein
LRQTWHIPGHNFTNRDRYAALGDVEAATIEHVNAKRAWEAAILRAHDRGCSSRDIAAKTGVSKTQIQRLVDRRATPAEPEPATKRDALWESVYQACKGLPDDEEIGTLNGEASSGR